VLIAEKERADYYELMVKEGADPKPAANWLINEYLGRLNKLVPAGGPTGPAGPILSGTDSMGPTGPSANSAIVQMITKGEISGKIGKDVLDHIIEHPGVDPRRYVQEHSLKQVTDMGAIEQAVDQVIAANPDKAEQAKAKPALAGWFVGQVMKATGGKASPTAVNDLIKKKLGIE
jgi:aspartyl-tRNA(Asn)/glutamyl-tRNA(Gln) amidotransferase subunit B